MLQIYKEQILSLNHKLLLCGVPINGPSYVFCDNQFVLNNSCIPESILLNNHNNIK